MPRLPKATLIETRAALETLVEQLAGEPLLAVDTESNSLHVYREQVCLVQLSTRIQDYIIDPLLISDMSPLGTLMADPAIEKVLHAAEYDISTMKRDFGYDFANIFDTMMAARIIGHPAVGLSTLLERHFSVMVDKRHQRDNWGERPLPEDSLRYAQMDTHYLPNLRDMLYNQLESRGHLDEARELFAEIAALPAAEISEFDPQGFWGIGRPARLKRPALLILRELYLMREDIAFNRDVPPFRIFSNHTMVEIARRAPQNLRELSRIDGMSSGQIGRYGEEILAAVELAQNHRGKLPRPPRPPRKDPVVVERYAMLHTWRKERALQRGVDSDVIISKQTLWHLAYHAPTSLDAMTEVTGMGPWRVETYGAEILDVLQDAP